MAPAQDGRAKDASPPASPWRPTITTTNPEWLPQNGLQAGTGCLWVAGVLCAVFVILLVIDKIVPSRALRYLPAGATDVREDYREAGWNGDYRRLLKARIPKENVEEYARKLGVLNPVNGDAGRLYPSWTTGPDWWNPHNAPLYYSSEAGHRILIGWEDGYVFFDSIAW